MREREGGGWTPPAGEGQRGSISVWRFDREARGVLNADPIVRKAKETRVDEWVYINSRDQGGSPITFRSQGIDESVYINS